MAEELQTEEPVTQAEVMEDDSQDEVDVVLDLSDIDDDIPSSVTTPEPSEVPETTDEPTPTVTEEVPAPGSEEPVAEKEAAPQEPAEVTTPEPEQQAPVQSFEEVRAQELARLEQTYQFSEEEARELQLEPEKVLPKLAARLYTDVFESAVQVISQSLPRMMESVTQQKTAREEAKNAFFQEFPDLKAHERQVEAALLKYKQLYPSATREQAIAQAGVQVSLVNKVPLPQKYLAQFGVPQVNEEQLQQRRGPIPPAGPGGSGGEPVQPSSNYYTRLAEEDVP